MGLVTKMDQPQHDFIEGLRNLGFAVTVFYPQELEGIDPHLVEEYMTMKASEYIDLHSKGETLC